jgi:hypothetical protein
MPSTESPIGEIAGRIAIIRDSGGDLAGLLRDSSGLEREIAGFSGFVGVFPQKIERLKHR